MYHKAFGTEGVHSNSINCAIEQLERAEGIKLVRVNLAEIKLRTKPIVYVYLKPENRFIPASLECIRNDISLSHTLFIRNPIAEIHLIESKPYMMGRTIEVLASDLFIPISNDKKDSSNKMEENKMLINGYKIVRIALTGEIRSHTPSALDGYRKAFAAAYADVGVGDTVVVANTDKRIPSYELAKVVEIGYTAEELNKKTIEFEVVDKVNTTDYEKRQSRAEEAVHLKKRMDAEIEKMKEQAAYEAFAEKNPALADMLSAYNYAVGNMPSKEE